MFEEHLGLTINVKLNFLEYIKNITQKLGKLCANCVDFNQSYQGHLFWLYIKHEKCVRLCWCHLRRSLYLLFSCFSGNNRSNKRDIIRKTMDAGLEKFYKILNKKSPPYLFDLIPNLGKVHETSHKIFLQFM